MPRENHVKTRHEGRDIAIRDATECLYPGDKIFLCKDVRGRWFWATKEDTWLLEVARYTEPYMIPTPQKHCQCMRDPYVMAAGLVG